VHVRIERSTRGTVQVIALRGELDGATASEAHDGLDGLLPEGGGGVALDLSGMTYVSSAGLRFLLLVHHHARLRGVRLALAGVRSDVHEVMSATGFIDAFVVADSVDDAVEALVR
jgi:anti-sigma B factor antagonist